MSAVIVPVLAHCHNIFFVLLLPVESVASPLLEQRALLWIVNFLLEELELLLLGECVTSSLLEQLLPLLLSIAITC